MTDGSAGMDLASAEEHEVLIPAGCRMPIQTGIAIELPEGYEAQIRSRSGLARKHGVATILGTVDSDYRGELGVLLVNLSNEAYCVKPGDRIAQLVVAPVARAHLIEASDLGETARGFGGFGSTGV